MKPGLTLAISAGVNVVLLVAAVHWLRPAASHVATLRPVASPAIETVHVLTNLPAETTFVTNAFYWRQLESTNYDEFVANLRSVGCPERTIRDIIVADVWERYETAAQREDSSAPFWLNGPRRVAAERAREAELRQLRQDLAALLRRLFGLVWSPELERDAFDSEPLICRALLGDVSEEQFERAIGWIFQTQEAKDEVGWRCRGVFLEEDYAELWRRRDEIEHGLRAILTPAQFEEFRARVGMAEHLFNSDGLDELKPTPEELRRIALARTEVYPLGWEVLDLDRSESPEQEEAREQALDERLREILGEERFTEALLLRDGSYRNIHQFTQANGVSKETARKLYEVQKLAREEVHRLREDKALEATVRQERLQAVTAEVAPEVSGLLGQKLFSEYLRQSGQWVTNANHL
jgi:hypothetical protein